MVDWRTPGQAAIDDGNAVPSEPGAPTKGLGGQEVCRTKEIVDLRAKLDTQDPALALGVLKQGGVAVAMRLPARGGRFSTPGNLTLVDRRLGCVGPKRTVAGLKDSAGVCG